MSTTIIVADENLGVRKAIKERLEQEGFQIIEADDGDMALDYALDFSPSLIIAEADMPVMDGWSLCANRHAYDELQGVPIILMGAFREAQDRVRAVELEADDYIAKPLQMDDLTARVYLTLKKTKEQKKTKTTFKGPQEIRLEGELALMPLPDLLQHFNKAGKSGILAIYPKSMGQQEMEGRIFFRAGEVIHSKVDKIKGNKALFRILTWSDGSFNFEEKDLVCNQTIYGNMISLLMEGMRLRDELEVLKQDLPELEKPLSINFSKEFFKWGLVHAHPNQIKLLTLLYRHHTLEKVMDYTDMEDLAIAKEAILLVQEGILTLMDK